MIDIITKSAEHTIPNTNVTLGLWNLQCFHNEFASVEGVTLPLQLT